MAEVFADIVWKNVPMERKEENKSKILSCNTAICFHRKPYLSRCLPEVAEKTATELYKGTGMDSIVDSVISDIELAWREIIYMTLIALGEKKVNNRAKP